MTSDRDFAEAESLWEFVADSDRASTNDLERTVRRVQRATDHSATAGPVPREAVWAQVMASTTPPRPATPSRSATGVIASGAWARQRLGRWQPAISLGLVLMFLASLLMFAHDRVVSPALATATPTEDIHGGMVPLGATPGMDEGCVAREVTWQGDTDPPGQAPIQRYQVMGRAEPNVAANALGLYIDFMVCLNHAGGTVSGTERAVLDTYLTGNAQLWSNDQLAGEMPRRPLIAESVTLDDQVTSDMVIPINQPGLTYSPRDPSIASFPIFWAEDVYGLIDGRYGVIIGTVSANEFRDGFSPSSDRLFGTTLTFVGFEMENGHLFIDEITEFCTADWVYLDADGNEVATPVTEETSIACR